MTGVTNSSDFPQTNANIQSGYKGNYDAFVTKLKPDGTGLVYSTYLDGTGFDQGNAIAA